MIGRRSFFAFALAGTSLLLLPGCDAGPTIERKKRLTVEVETPKGVRSGYSVIKYWARQRSSNPLDPYKGGLGAQARGEAVAVDLPGGRTLFALLQTETDVDAIMVYPGLAFAAEIGAEQDITKRLKLLQALKGQTRALPRTEMTLPNSGTQVSAYPLIVTFKDINDSKSLERVDPDNLAASFGVGYTLKAITITITDEPMTKGIERRLTWLGQYPEPRLDSEYKGSANPNLSQKLSHGHFRKGYQ